ncbi:hypothetical protein GobsT_30910 [Gemmata obscuriglobus]|uniref:hypothetical protein n=1 Tax=Gemmata obscuriglobus TaxID=114 RepID=UPI00016C3931|nr:hypothetical protein [Gemmata obscuriglobus]QEG28314.1 hypothetical protein GobsT_30910 [Gemmata obscuriglobus]VTS06165.1 Uncharacterized protein OS=Herpetosiphon aurantiacus (strain ATCC 23779 / DSM 785) GN=Haur_0654 PE=4 SV=1 [Gemmata obscuriglobus UQM 2246]
MRLNLRKLREQVESLKRQVASKGWIDYAKYRTDPAGYARDILKVKWWAKQVEIAEALCKPPYRVLVKASHSVGKSHLAGGLVNWWYDTRFPGVCLTTAPTDRQVKDVLWKEVRRQRRKRPGFVGPKMPRLESDPTHFAHGFTARDATSFQGQHEASILLIFDEAVGIDGDFWEAAESMCQGAEYGWLAIFNPTDTTSRAYLEEQAGSRWTVIDIPATEHPNIAAELVARPPEYPSAVRLNWLRDRLEQWAERIEPGDATPTDIQFPNPDGSPQWWRPGPLADARLLARWPASGCGVWSDPVWRSVERAAPDPVPERWLPQIGCDVARFGEDWTELHVRCGNVSLHHEAHNGWDTKRTTERLKQMCGEWAQWATQLRDRGADPIDPRRIPVKVDDDGVGGGVTDQRGGFNFQAVSSASNANDKEAYPNRRSELWFTVADRAKRGELFLSNLPAHVRQELKRQAMAPTYKLDAAGRRVVEPKEDTKERIGRSPDGMDAVNLAYYEPSGRGGAVAVEGSRGR